MLTRLEEFIAIRALVMLQQLPGSEMGGGDLDGTGRSGNSAAPLCCSVSESLYMPVCLFGLPRFDCTFFKFLLTIEVGASTNRVLWIQVRVAARGT